MEKKIDDKKNDLKVYNVYVKYVEMVMDDGDVLIYEAYSPFPRGHSIDNQLVKLSLKSAISNINAMNDEDGLRMDYHGSVAYAPSTIKKVRWSKDEDIGKGTYLIDVGESKDDYKLNELVKVSGDNYKIGKIIDWTANLKTKFLYCTKILKVKKPDVIEAVKAIKDEVDKE